MDVISVEEAVSSSITEDDEGSGVSGIDFDLNTFSIELDIFLNVYLTAYCFRPQQRSLKRPLSFQGFLKLMLKLLRLLQRKILMHI